MASRLVPGCGEPSAVDAAFTLGEPFWLALGERSVSADGPTAIRFVAVVGDSRCPEGAMCVWAGEATVDVGVRVAAGDRAQLRVMAAR